MISIKLTQQKTYHPCFSCIILLFRTPLKFLPFQLFIVPTHSFVILNSISLSGSVSFPQNTSFSYARSFMYSTSVTAIHLLSFPSSSHITPSTLSYLALPCHSRSIFRHSHFFSPLLPVTLQFLLATLQFLLFTSAFSLSISSFPLSISSFPLSPPSFPLSPPSFPRRRESSNKKS